jgi:hypothetical protein
MQVGQLADGAKRSLAGLVASVWRAEGVRGLYRGVVPTATGAFINMGLYFALYDHLRTRLRRAFPSAPSPSSRATASSPPRPAMGLDLIAAAAGGAVCAVAVNPFWVLKLHRITASPATAAHGSSLLASARRIVNTQGIRGYLPPLCLAMLAVISHTSPTYIGCTKAR